MRRRQSLSAMFGGMAVLGTTPARSAAANGLRAGEGVVDITPPLGIELAGYHKPPGQERRVLGIRQPAEVRALVLTCNSTQVATRPERLRQWRVFRYRGTQNFRFTTVPAYRRARPECRGRLAA